jgi:hypothetical protein
MLTQVSAPAEQPKKMTLLRALAIVLYLVWKRVRPATLLRPASPGTP